MFSRRYVRSRSVSQNRLGSHLRGIGHRGSCAYVLFERGFYPKTDVHFWETLLRAGSLQMETPQFGDRSRFFVSPRDFKGKPISTLLENARNPGVPPVWIDAPAFAIPIELQQSARLVYRIIRAQTPSSSAFARECLCYKMPSAWMHCQANGTHRSRITFESRWTVAAPSQGVCLSSYPRVNQARSFPASDVSGWLASGWLGCDADALFVTAD